MAGYIGTQPVPQATQTRDTFTATASQTSFATSGYTPGFLDVFLNGVHLQNGTDYTASNGSDVVLTAGAAVGDVLEVVAYTTYEVNSQNYTGGLTVDNDGATVLTVDRATSDGTIIDVQKGGTTVGSIGTKSFDLYIGKAESGLLFDVTGADGIRPFNTTAQGESDANLDLGSSSARFKDLYLSGGVYLGGTGSANHLDDYEEGTWTPELEISSSTVGITYNNRHGFYTKIGRTVHICGTVTLTNKGSNTGTVFLHGLPFALADLTGDTSLESGSQSVDWYNGTNNVYHMSLISHNSQGGLAFYKKLSATGTLASAMVAGDISDTFAFRIGMTYVTNA